MNKDTDTTRKRILQGYKKYVLKKGRPPASIYKLCKSIDLKEPEFYQRFASLDAVATATWVDILQETADVVHADTDFADYPLREKLLAYLYTFLEGATEHRSYLIATWPGANPQDRKLRGVSCAYRELNRPWVDQAMHAGELAARGASSRVYSEVFTLHLIAVTGFWLKDESHAFERTDAFVEKTVTLAMDLVGRGAIESGLDLARFFAGSCR